MIKVVATSRCCNTVGGEWEPRWCWSGSGAREIASTTPPTNPEMMSQIQFHASLPWYSMLSKENWGIWSKPRDTNMTAAAAVKTQNPLLSLAGQTNYEQSLLASVGLGKSNPLTWVLHSNMYPQWPMPCSYIRSKSHMYYKNGIESRIESPLSWVSWCGRKRGNSNTLNGFWQQDFRGALHFSTWFL